MAEQRMNFVTPVGRLVQGDPVAGFGSKTDRKTGKPLMDKAGINPITKYYLALAIPKTTVGTAAYDAKGSLILGSPLELIGMLRAEGKKGFPNLFDASGNCSRTDFAFKYVDGDSTAFNQENKRWCDIEGFPGNWIFKFNTTLPVALYDMNNNKIDLSNNPIKRGHYIRVWGYMSAGTDASKPSVFLNPGAVMHVAYGAEIVGFDTSDVFSGVPQSALPAGASTVPIASTALPAGMASQTAAPVIPQFAPQQTPAAQAPAYQPPVQPGPTVQPVPSFVNPPLPPAAPAPAPAPAAPSRYQTGGVAYTFDQLTAYGWNVEQINALPRVA